ncbi:MAG: hypothetical protein ACLP01_08240 [Solirubrobacteraceae bacterium]
MDERDELLSPAGHGRAEDTVMRDYVAGSANRLLSRKQEFAEREEALRAEGQRRAADLEHARAAQARAVRRQVRREWRASLSPAERALDSARALRRVCGPWLLAILPLVVGAALAAGLIERVATLAECGVLFFVVVVLANRVIERRRARRLPDGYSDRVSDQLDRVKAAAPPAGDLAPYWS